MEIQIRPYPESFQKEILSLVLKNQSFAINLKSNIEASALVRSTIFKLFTIKSLNVILKVVFDLMDKNENTVPSIGALELELTHHNDSHELIGIIKMLMELEVKKSGYHNQKIENFIKCVRFVEFENLLRDTVVGGWGDITKNIKIFEEYAKKISNVTMEGSSVITFDNPFEILSNNGMALQDAIKLGIAPFDNATAGGLGFVKGSTILFFGSSNDGKSFIVSTDIAVNIASAGKQVVILNLEGDRYLLPIRILSRITGIHVNRLDAFKSKGNIKENGEIEVNECENEFSHYFSSLEIQKIKKARETLKNIRIIHSASSKAGRNVDRLIEEVDQLHNDAPIDVLISDYLALGTCENNKKAKYENSSANYEKVGFFCQRINALHIAIAQANREGVKDQKEDRATGDKPILREFHLGGGIDVFHDSAYAISISANAHEKRMGVRRLTLLKNRKGPTDITIEVKGDWGHARPISGGNLVVINGSTELRNFVQMENTVGRPATREYESENIQAPLRFSGEENEAAKQRPSYENYQSQVPKALDFLNFSGLDYKNVQTTILRMVYLDDLKKIENKIFTLENNGTHEQTNELLNRLEDAKKSICQKIESIKPTRDLIDFYNKEVVPHKNKIQELMKDKAKTKELSGSNFGGSIFMFVVGLIDWANLGRGPPQFKAA